MAGTSPSIACLPNGGYEFAVPYRKATVVSADGTTIGYRVYGEGPAVLLVHGALQSSASFDQLATMLSDAFTVCVPDRRGRGASGPFGEGHGLATECADVDALVRATGATSIFGLSSGAIIALAAAEVVSSVTRVAAYEPPLTTAHADPGSWAPRFERDLASDDLGAAMATIVIGAGDRDLLSWVPRAVLVRLFRFALAADARKARGDDVPIAELIPTVRFDCLIQREGSARLADFGRLRADVLLLGGDRSALSLVDALDDLAKILPAARRTTLRGVGHVAASYQRKPANVAAALRRFFAGD